MNPSGVKTAAAHIVAELAKVISGSHDKLDAVDLARLSAALNTAAILRSNAEDAAGLTQAPPRS